MSRRSASLECAMVALLLAGTGCSTLNNNSNASNDKSWSPTTWFKKEFQEPVSMAAIWSPDTLAVAGQPASRGFGGRIYFYNDRTQAVPIEGELMVHGYLTTPGQVDPSTVQPDQKFAFSAEQLSGHFSPSEIGASYSIWIPWDQLDGYREEVTLIPTFKSKNGTVVQGAPAKVFLPGKARQSGDMTAPNVQSVSYQRQSQSTNVNPNDAYARNSYVSNSYGLETPPTTSHNASLPRMNTVRTTTIAVPDDATLNRRPSTSFTLGGSNPGTTSQQSGSSAVQVGGVGVGGGQSSKRGAVVPSTAPVPSQTNNSPSHSKSSLQELLPVNLPGLSTTATSAKLNLRALPPPPVDTPPARRTSGATIGQPQSAVATASSTSSQSAATEPRFAPVRSAGYESQ